MLRPITSRLRQAQASNVSRFVHVEKTSHSIVSTFEMHEFMRSLGHEARVSPWSHPSSWTFPEQPCFSVQLEDKRLKVLTRSDVGLSKHSGAWQLCLDSLLSDYWESPSMIPQRHSRIADQLQRRAWHAVWQPIWPLLDTQALQATQKTGNPTASGYNLMLEHPRLAQLAQRSRMLAAMAADHPALLSFDPKTLDLGVEDLFLFLMQQRDGSPWPIDVRAGARAYLLGGQPNWPSGWWWGLANSLAQVASALDVNRIRQLSTRRQWQVLHLCLDAHDGVEEILWEDQNNWPYLSIAFLNNPQAAMHALDGYYPPQIRIAMGRRALHSAIREIHNFGTQEHPENMGFPQIARLARQWHQDFAHANHRPLPKRARGLTFPPSPFGELEFENFRLHYIATGHELEAEGQEMRNCLSTYWKECARGNIFVYSLRTLTGESVASLEISRHGMLGQMVQEGDLPVSSDLRQRVRLAFGASKSRTKEPILPPA